MFDISCLICNIYTKAPAARLSALEQQIARLFHYTLQMLAFPLFSQSANTGLQANLIIITSCICTTEITNISPIASRGYLWLEQTLLRHRNMYFGSSWKTTGHIALWIVYICVCVWFVLCYFCPWAHVKTQSTTLSEAIQNHINEITIYTWSTATLCRVMLSPDSWCAPIVPLSASGDKCCKFMTLTHRTAKANNMSAR